MRIQFSTFIFTFTLNISGEQKCWFDAQRYRYFTMILALSLRVTPIFVLIGVKHVPTMWSRENHVTRVTVAYAGYERR